MRLTANKVTRLLTILALAVSVSGCGGTVATPTPVAPKVVEPTRAPTPPAQAAKKELFYGLTLSIAGLDPHIHTSSELGIPLTSVYDTLVYMTTDNRFVPGLAESWTVSPDGLSYAFKLRKDVKFHDGTPFNAQAVKDNLDRVVDPATKSGKAAALLGPYKGTEVVDEFTAKVTLSKPYMPLLDSLAQVYLGMASPTAFKKWGPSDYQLHQAGTGPFKFNESQYVPKDTIVLDRNPDYNWAPSVYKHNGPAYLDRIVFKFFPDPPTRSPALETNAVQIMGELPPQDAVRLQQDARYQVVVADAPGMPLLFFLNAANPPTDDLKVRQALLYGTDRAAIVKTIFQGLSPVAYGPWSHSALGYDKSVEPMYPYDAGKARALLDEAGWKAGADGIRLKDGRRLTLETYLQTWGYLSETGQMLQAQFKQIGVELKTQIVAFPAAQAATKEGKHNVAPNSLSATDPSFLSPMFHTSGAYDWSKYDSPSLDKLLDQADGETDQARRMSLYGQVQRMAMEQALVIPIRDYTNWNGASAKVKGLVYDAHGWWPYLYDVDLTP
jgi:peptide/nickel transport system substrate-binding protein